MRVQWAVMGTLELLLRPDCGLAQTMKSSLFVKPTVIQFPIFFFSFSGASCWAYLVNVPKLFSGAHGTVTLDHDRGLPRGSFESSVLAETPARSFPFTSRESSQECPGTLTVARAGGMSMTANKSQT